MCTQNIHTMNLIQRTEKSDELFFNHIYLQIFEHNLDKESVIRKIREKKSIISMKKKNILNLKGKFPCLVGVPRDRCAGWHDFLT